MSSRSPIPRIALPVIAALLALSQTILGQTALGQFIRARLQAKLMQMLMDGITEFFRDLAARLPSPGNTIPLAEPAPPSQTARRSRRTSDPPGPGNPARRDPLRPPDAPDHPVDLWADPPAEAPEAGVPRPEPPERQPAPAPRGRRRATHQLASPHRARSPPDAKMA